jgi:hypothetical protein
MKNRSETWTRAVGVDANQVVVERRVVDLREGNTVSDDRLAKQLIGIGYNVGGIQQMIIRQVADRTSVIVGGKHAVPERCLVQPMLDQAQSVASLDRARCRRRGRCTRELAKRDPRA